MLIVIALGGNALLMRGEALTVENQRANVAIAASVIAEIIEAGHKVVITHGNGPQVGLLALQNTAYKADQAYPLDVLGAETEGMIGYLIEQALENVLPVDQRVATLLTQVEVDVDDPAFREPTKPVGPVYNEHEASVVSAHHQWVLKPDGTGFRRVVASPKPKSIPDVGIIRLLLEQNIIVICAGGGGIPVVRFDDGRLAGVEAVIDKDHASGLLARELGADALLMLTDVDGVYRHWSTPTQSLINHATPSLLREIGFASGSMSPKIDAACDFVEATGGRVGIGALVDARRIIAGEAGTLIANVNTD